MLRLRLSSCGCLVAVRVRGVEYWGVRCACAVLSLLAVAVLFFYLKVKDTPPCVWSLN